MNAIIEVGKKNNIFTVAFSSDSDSEEDNEEVKGDLKLFDLIRHANIQGLVIFGESIKNKNVINYIVDIGKEKNIPVFVMNRVIEGCYNIKTDYGYGFEEMVRHVVEHHGYKRVDMLAGFQGNDISDERVNIYKKVLEENGIPVEKERIGYGNFWDRPARVAMAKFLEYDLPEAIVCANDSMAITACSVLEEHGYSVPEDVVVTGFDGIQSGQYHFPKLSTCVPDFIDVAEFIAEQMEIYKRLGTVNPCDHSVLYKFREDQSCGCKPKEMSEYNVALTSLTEEMSDCIWHTITMNQMQTAMLEKTKIWDVAKELPSKLALWLDHYRFACIKSDIVDGGEYIDEFNELTTILETNMGEFLDPGKTFQIDDFIPGLDEILEVGGEYNILVICMINSGHKAYGYIAEAFDFLTNRGLERCNEFHMFLSNTINTVIHNYQLSHLNQELMEAYKRIENLSLYDPLTQLYNRRGFFEKLQEIMENDNNKGMYLTIISVDMDGLKYINDTFGHAEGDYALTCIAKALEKVVYKYGVSSRFGGDEFSCAVVSDNYVNNDDCHLTDDLKKCIYSLEGVKDKPYPIEGSVGICCKKIEGTLDAEEMIKIADSYMYQNKIDRKKERKA
ncbi:MAG: GGDEF domain-containing protein [Lachnospiraceae bacterium]|nr:GGDEF domain-containing protein [Lachnospiraceae bacterium]